MIHRFCLTIGGYANWSVQSGDACSPGCWVAEWQESWETAGSRCLLWPALAPSTGNLKNSTIVQETVKESEELYALSALIFLHFEQGAPCFLCTGSPSDMKKPLISRPEVQTVMDWGGLTD